MDLNIEPMLVMLRTPQNVPDYFGKISIKEGGDP
jgi:hypothetical protein